MAEIVYSNYIKLFAWSFFNHGQAKLLKYNDYFPEHGEGDMIPQILQALMDDVPVAKPVNMMMFLQSGLVL